jgi:alkaline phosphatase D
MSRENFDDRSRELEMPGRRRALFTALAGVAAPAMPALGFAADKSAAQPDELVVMHGFADQTGILLWLQSARARRIAVDILGPDAAGKPIRTIEADLELRNDCTATVAMAGLDPGTIHHYVIRRLDTKAALAKGSFKTQPLWQWRTDPPAVRIATGSCAYFNEPRFDRPGNPYGGGYEIFDSIAAESPDLMLWLGDNIYLNEVDYSSREGINRRYRYCRAQPSLRKLLAACPQVAIWDDHDFGPDDSDASYPGAGWSLEMFKRYWPLPYAPPADGLYGKILQGDVDIFMLDDRSYRYPDHWPEGPEKAMYGAKQVQWLKAALTFSRAPFKIVAGGSQFLNKVSGVRRESWARYPAEQGDFLRWLEERKIPGVFLISGDRHFAQMLRVERPNLYPLVEITTSPLTSGIVSSIEEAEKNGKDIVPGTMLFERNFAMITVTGPRAKRELVLEIRNTKGEKKWEWKTTAAELAVGTRT